MHLHPPPFSPTPAPPWPPSRGGHSEPPGLWASGNQEGQSPNNWATAGSPPTQAHVSLHESPPGRFRKAPGWAPAPDMTRPTALRTASWSGLACGTLVPHLPLLPRVTQPLVPLPSLPPGSWEWTVGPPHHPEGALEPWGRSRGGRRTANRAQLGQGDHSQCPDSLGDTTGFWSQFCHLNSQPHVAGGHIAQ